MPKVRGESKSTFEYIIVGAGIAGCKLFYHLSKVAPCLLVDQSAPISPYKKAKVVCFHSLPWLEELHLDSPTESVIPTQAHWKAIYASRNREVVVDGQEFGQQLSVIINEYDIRKWYLDNANPENGKLLWNSQCVNISRESANLQWRLSIKDNQISQNSQNPKNTQNHQAPKNTLHPLVSTLTANCLILATGASGLKQSPSLQANLGFKTPTLYNGISCTFTAPAEVLDQNIPMQYQFRLHPQISTTGMLFINRFRNFFNIGFVEQSDRPAMEAKFLRILRKYAPIQDFFKGVDKTPTQVTPEDFSFFPACKGRVQKIVKDGVALVGDTAGLLYPLYFEGIAGVGASTLILASVLHEIYEKKLPYNAKNLQRYQEQLQHSIISKYMAAGDMSDELFFRFNEQPPFAVWDAYLQSIAEVKQVRKNIHHAYVCQDLANYPIENDNWVGEQLFHRLSPAKKVTLLPKFVKFKLKHNY
ncbi:MAG: NAD(P)/FAD-dependent oxidoreductase [Promethearchaeota archaeon]